MRRRLAAFVWAAVSASVSFTLSACSANGSPSSSSAVPGFTVNGNMPSNASRSGLAGVRQLPRAAAVARPQNRLRKVGPKYLYVSDFSTNAVEILANAGWTGAGTIDESIDGPDGNWVDKSGNLYVANYKGASVTEYAPGASSPTFTYASGMNDPVGVATDRQGNVYEADFAGGYVNEYRQGSDAVVATCSPGGSVEGVTLDASGDVFVDFYTGSVGSIVEYVGGLSGCSGTLLGATLGFPGGMTADWNGTLLVCDQTAPAVDVIRPPYSTVAFSLGSNWKQPFHVTVSKAKKEAYVADFGAADVVVLRYPHGSTIATLNSANGLGFPSSAVDGENFIP